MYRQNISIKTITIKILFRKTAVFPHSVQSKKHKYIISGKVGSVICITE